MRTRCSRSACCSRRDQVPGCPDCGVAPRRVHHMVRKREEEDLRGRCGARHERWCTYAHGQAAVEARSSLARIVVGQPVAGQGDGGRLSTVRGRRSGAGDECGRAAGWMVALLSVRRVCLSRGSNRWSCAVNSPLQGSRGAESSMVSRRCQHGHAAPKGRVFGQVPVVCRQYALPGEAVFYQRYCTSTSSCVRRKSLGARVAWLRVWSSWGLRVSCGLSA